MYCTTYSNEQEEVVEHCLDCDDEEDEYRCENDPIYCDCNQCVAWWKYETSYEDFNDETGWAVLNYIMLYEPHRFFGLSSFKGYTTTERTKEEYRARAMIELDELWKLILTHKRFGSFNACMAVQDMCHAAMVLLGTPLPVNHECVNTGKDDYINSLETLIDSDNYTQEDCARFDILLRWLSNNIYQYEV